ncbi:hypothetical protein MT49_2194 [Mycobacterium tuberculosis 49-02]|nr:hypothetical protein MT49_2194 [Mycobacterium tuberculosis 49-02]
MSADTGIFSGMFSEPYPTDGEVMTELGDKFLAALVGTIRDTRFDIADMRNWRPGWFPTMHSRCLSNLIHDRIWAHLVTLIASNPGTSIKVNRPGESGDSLI